MILLDPYRLEKYKAAMDKMIIEASKQDHTIHGYMVYQHEYQEVKYVKVFAHV